MYSTIFLGLSLAAWVTIAVVLALFLSLIFTKIPEDIAFMGVIAVLGLSGVLPEKEVLSGFSSSSVVVVGVLFIVIAGLVHTGVLQWLMKHVLGTPRSYPAAIVRLMGTVAALSAILSNTTVVALFVQIVKRWAGKLGVAPSKLLIPLSYASGMGGVCTLIGTPPNLIIAGMYAQESGAHINFFATTVPGLVCLAVGILSMLAMRRLLPVRKSPDEEFSQTQEYTVELLVPADHPQIGNTIQESGLYDTPHGKLIELIRFDRAILSPVLPDEPIMGGDRLVYSGKIEELLQIREEFGLVNADHPVFTVDELDKHRQLRTAYIMPGCELIGKPVSRTHFERDHQITLVAAARQGQRITRSPRDIRLQTGDSVLIECAPGSANTPIRGLQFFDNQEIVQHGRKTMVSALILLAMVILSSLNILPLLQSATLAAIAMLVFRCCTPGQAFKSIEWSILMVFAGSVVIGKAIETTGIAQALAEGVMQVCNGKPLLVMTMMCLTAMFVTAFISNTATGAIFFPIVYHSAVSMGCDPLPFLISLMIAVSSSFATPIGSPTHLLVYGPGGYRFTDFLKAGIPMTIVILLANLLIVNLIYPL